MRPIGIMRPIILYLINYYYNGILKTKDYCQIQGMNIKSTMNIKKQQLFTSLQHKVHTSLSEFRLI